MTSVIKWIKKNPNKLGLAISAILAWGSGRGYVEPDTLAMIITLLSALGLSVGTMQDIKAKKHGQP